MKKISIVIGIIVILLVVISIGVYSLNNKQTVSAVKDNSNDFNKNEITEKSEFIIEKDKTFNINVKTLADEIVKVYDAIQKENNTAYKFSLTYETDTLKDNDGNNCIVYNINIKGFETIQNPFIMLVADAKTKNVYRICVYYPYLNNGYGRKINTSEVQSNYTLLFRALRNINQTELIDTIDEILEFLSKNTKEISEDFNINNVYIGNVMAQNNQYVNEAGFYIFYATK